MDDSAVRGLSLHIGCSLLWYIRPFIFAWLKFFNVFGFILFGTTSHFNHAVGLTFVNRRFAGHFLTKVGKFLLEFILVFHNKL